MLVCFGLAPAPAPTVRLEMGPSLPVLLLLAGSLVLAPTATRQARADAAPCVPVSFPSLFSIIDILTTFFLQLLLLLPLPLPLPP